MLRLKLKLKRKSIQDIFSEKELSTIDYLQKEGFSERMINQFFKPFLTGIFLENRLSTSSRMFEFVFKMFSEGDAAIPAKGMGMIPLQLAQSLSADELVFNEKVEKIDGGAVFTSSRSVYKAKYILIATTQIQMPAPFQQQVLKSYRSVTNMYFTSNKKPFDLPLIGLNTLSGKLVNNIAVMDQISSAYSSKGKSLISLSLIGNHSQANQSQLQDSVIAEMKFWYTDAANWKHLKTYHINYALPNDDQVTNDLGRQFIKLDDQCYVCGDYLMNGSINASMKSGRLAAEAIIEATERS